MKKRPIQLAKTGTLASSGSESGFEHTRKRQSVVDDTPKPMIQSSESSDEEAPQVTKPAVKTLRRKVSHKVRQKVSSSDDSSDDEEGKTIPLAKPRKPRPAFSKEAVNNTPRPRRKVTVTAAPPTSEDSNGSDNSSIPPSPHL